VKNMESGRTAAVSGQMLREAACVERLRSGDCGEKSREKSEFC